MQRPGPYLALALGLFADPTLRRVARQMPSPIITWYGLWTWMLCKCAGQHRIGRLEFDRGEIYMLSEKLPWDDVVRFCRLLEEEGRVTEMAIDEVSIHLRFVNWRQWQSLSRTEQKWAAREREAGRNPDPGGGTSTPTVPVSGADPTPAGAHKTRQDKTTSSSSVIRARAREAAEALADAFGEEEGFRLRLEDRIVARLETTGADGGEAVRAVHRLLGRLAEGWTPAAGDGGVGWMLSLIGTQIEVPADALATAAVSGRVAGSALDEYIGRFGKESV